MDSQILKSNQYLPELKNQYVQLLEEAHREVMELAGEAMQFGNYKRAEQIVRDGFYEIAFKDYQRSVRIYNGIKKWAEENNCEEIAKESLSKILDLNIEQQKQLHNFDKMISPLILRIKIEGEKK